MAKLELSEETKAGMEEVKEADLLIAVAVPVDAEQLRAAATQAVLGMDQPAFSALRTVVAFPGVSGAEAAGRQRQTRSRRKRTANCASFPIRCPPAARREFPGYPLPARIRRCSPWRASWG